MDKTTDKETIPVYKKLAQKLYDLFFVDEHKYGRQVENGTYRLIKAKVSPVTIDDMLLNGKSLLTYQESHSIGKAFIKWVCLDLDLDRRKIKENTADPGEDAEVSIDDLKKVKKAADQVSAFLNQRGIPHLQEFSGRRGFHIWIIFDVTITKEQGYQLAKLIADKVKLDEVVNIDLFPKTFYVAKNSKGIGSGVKLPLSVHQSSGNLSYILANGAFNYGNYKLAKLTDTFMEHQLQLLDSLRMVSLPMIEPLLQEYAELNKTNPAVPYMNYSRFSVGTSGASLDAILESLKGCDRLRETILNYRKELNPKERNIFVGLLAQLTTENDPDFGYKLLMEFFSRVSGFRKDLTEQKLKLSKYYYPVTCASLGKCEACKCDEVRSPIELHKDVLIVPKPKFSIENISDKLFGVIIEAESKYTRINDEIPLYNILEKLQNADIEQLRALISEVFKGNLPAINENFRFERNEVDKIRCLYTLEPLHALASTYFLYLMNNMFYQDFSANSYGYRVAPGFYNSNIFSNWFANWSAYSKHIQRILENEEYLGYYMIKIDVRNFYDRIDLQLLKVKLYEEALPGIDQRVKSLSDQERKRYLNILKYLIYLSEQTVGGHIGLPQGPAYARFLAEIYLLGLDQMIEQEILRDRRREFYYRFVDDIFIFVETEKKARQVLERVRNWASANALDLNPNKTELSSVNDYASSGKFKKFQDDAKYAINQGNKNKELLSEEERQEVIARVERLTDETKFGLKDNLRFFYYHFSADPRLNHVKDKITNLLPFSKSGRGTLYMLLYADLFENKTNFFWELAKQQQRLSGLSLGHYLNTILLNFEQSREKRDEVDELIRALSQRQDLSYSDKSLILTLAMKYDIKPPAELLEVSSEKLIFSVMETPNLEYTESNYDLLYSMLESKQEIEFLDVLFNTIHQHELSPWVALNLASYGLTRFSRWSERPETASKLAEASIALKYYHCICFLTLFDQSENPVPVQLSWENLLAKTQQIDLEGRPIKFSWISNAIKIFSGKLSASAFSLMLGDLRNSKLNTFSCTNGFVKQFKDILLIFYFEKGTLTEEMIDRKEELIRQDTLFAEWLFNSKTELYPRDKDICVKNLALNGLIVLQNDDQIFIKNINGHLSYQQFPYLQVQDKNDDSEIVISKEGMNPLPIYQSSEDLVALVVKIGLQIQADIAFRDTFDKHYPVYYDFPYQKENNPLIPFYSTFDQKITNEGIVQNNDAKSYWETLIHIASLRNRNLRLLNQADHPFDFSFTDLSERLIPKSDLFVRTDQDRLDFMVEFSKQAENKQVSDIYEYQYVWSSVLWKILTERGSSDGRTFLQFLHIHFSTFNGIQLAAADILFGIDSKSVAADNTLEELRLSIRNSFISFQNNVRLNEFNVVELFDNEIQPVIEKLPEGTLLNDFKKTKLSFETDLNTSSNKEETKILLAKEDVSAHQFMVYHTDDLVFYNKNAEELNSSLAGRQYYILNQQHILYIIPVEHQLSNAFNRVDSRLKTYKKSLAKQDSYLKVFPSSESYLKAEQTYNQAQSVTIEHVLKNHYPYGTDIKSRIVRWLNLFNETSLSGSKTLAFLNENGYGISDLHKSILQVLSQHIAVTDEDLQFFKETILREHQSGSIIFAIKDHRTDGNGLALLLDKIGFELRDIDFNASYAQMTSGSLAGKTLVIATDISLSGTQTFHGLNYYDNLPESDEALKELWTHLEKSNERYFKFQNREAFEKCRINFMAAKEIKFISLISTQEFKDKIEGHALLVKREDGMDRYCVLSNREFESPAFRLSGIQLDDHNRRIFTFLVQDIELIEQIFTIKEGYSKSVRLPGENNVVLRIRSLPKEHIRLFSLGSKNGNFSLFDYRPNWDTIKIKNQE